MSKPLIELINCESGDWEVLRMNLGEDYKYEGHSIPDFAWIKILKKLGFTVIEKSISDEDMEMGNF